MVNVKVLFIQMLVKNYLAKQRSLWLLMLPRPLGISSVKKGSLVLSDVVASLTLAVRECDRSSVSADLCDLSVSRLIGRLDEHGLGQLLTCGHCHLLNLVQLLSISKLVKLLLPLLHF